MRKRRSLLATSHREAKGCAQLRLLRTDLAGHDREDESKAIHHRQPGLYRLTVVYMHLNIVTLNIKRLRKIV